MRPVSQRVNAKKTHENNTEFGKSTSELLILKPEGYPLSGMMDEYPVIENRDVFEFYAREQWNGCVARKGDYLFDRRMFPDFAYRIIDVEPAESMIGNSTSIIVTEEENGLPSSTEIKSSVIFEDVVGQELAKQKCRLIERFLEEPERFGKWAPRNILFYRALRHRKNNACKSPCKQNRCAHHSCKSHPAYRRISWEMEPARSTSSTTGQKKWLHV